MITSKKLFAPEYNRDGNGWIRFPPSKPLSDVLFVPESSTHPARCNLYMLQAIYQYVAQPGEVLLDITSGVGSLMMAELEGYHTILIELSEYFHSIQQLNAEYMEVQPVMLLGDCRDYLPLPCDHIIFSPPYSTTYHTDTKKGSLSDEKFKAWAVERNWRGYDGHDHYVKDDPRNLGLLNPFMFGQVLEKIYKLCFDSVRSGGTMSIIIADFIKGGEVVELGYLAIKQCQRIGWELQDVFYRWQAGTPKKSLHRSLGHRVIEKEDVIILRKP